MSKNHIPNSPPFQPMRQPIHFYATTRNSMHEICHGMPHICTVISPSIYFSSKISPIKSHSSVSNNRSPQTQFNVDRVLNSSYPSKYSKLTSKIQMLQNNLNRLNGQHQSLLSMFEISEELTKTSEVFASIDQLRQRLEESKRNKHIEEKRYEARHEVVYEDLIKRFQELEESRLHIQKAKITEIQQRTKTHSQNNKSANIYDTIFSYSVQSRDSLKSNTQRYMNQIHNSVEKYSFSMIKKFRVQAKIKQEEMKVQQKIQNIKIKLGQIKCMTEYEMFLAKQYGLNQEINRLKGQFQGGKEEVRQEQRLQKMNKLQLRFIKDEMRFVTMESIDRFAFQLASIDSKFVKVIQKYQTTNNSKIHKRQKHKLNPTKQLSSNTKTQQKQTIEQEVQIIHCELSRLNNEVLGLKKYFNNSIQNVNKIQTGCKNLSTEKDYVENKQFLQSLEDIQHKINILDSNLTFFKSIVLINELK